jgi:hypothetical protein
MEEIHGLFRTAGIREILTAAEKTGQHALGFIVDSSAYDGDFYVSMVGTVTGRSARRRPTNESAPRPLLVGGMVVRSVHSPIALSDWDWSEAGARDPPLSQVRLGCLRCSFTGL